MCLYPKLIKNPKYKPNKKNKGIVPECKDIRLKYVAIGCGNCIECRKQLANSWRTRLINELENNKDIPYYVTLTFSNEELTKLLIQLKQTENNYVLTKAVRYYLERHRKKYKTSIKHWLISELGHEGTERIHLHGIIWLPKEINKEEITKIWKYGNVVIGDYCNIITINYIMKYVTKIDTDHKDYKSIILCSKGIGNNYTKDIRNKMKHKYIHNNTIEYYQLKNGTKVGLPIYYRNKLFSEEEREKLWLEKLDKEERYILGIKYKTKTEEELKTFYEAQKLAQEKNERIGYGTDGEEWKKKEYNTTLNMIRKKDKIKVIKKISQIT